MPLSEISMKVRIQAAKQTNVNKLSEWKQTLDAYPSIVSTLILYNWILHILIYALGTGQEPLLAHLFHVLTACQAMQRFQIILGKNCTIHSLLESEFPPLKSTNNKPTPYVTPKTLAYIHGLICDSVTLFHSDACNARALCNEIMILEVLEAEEPAVFRQELFTTLVHYYQEIQGLHGAAGRPKPKSFKHKMKSTKSRAAPADAAGGESTENAPEAPAAAAATAPAGLPRVKGDAKA